MQINKYHVPSLHIRSRWTPNNWFSGLDTLHFGKLGWVGSRHFLWIRALQIVQDKAGFWLEIILQILFSHMTQLFCNSAARCSLNKIIISPIQSNISNNTEIIGPCLTKIWLFGTKNLNQKYRYGGIPVRVGLNQVLSCDLSYRRMSTYGFTHAKV